MAALYVFSLEFVVELVSVELLREENVVELVIAGLGVENVVELVSAGLGVANVVGGDDGLVEGFVVVDGLLVVVEGLGLEGLGVDGYAVVVESVVVIGGAVGPLVVAEVVDVVAGKSQVLFP